MDFLMLKNRFEIVKEDVRWLVIYNSDADSPIIKFILEMIMFINGKNNPINKYTSELTKACGLDFDFESISINSLIEGNIIEGFSIESQTVPNCIKNYTLPEFLSLDKNVFFTKYFKALTVFSLLRMSFTLALLIHPDDEVLQKVIENYFFNIIMKSDDDLTFQSWLKTFLRIDIRNNMSFVDIIMYSINSNNLFEIVDDNKIVFTSKTGRPLTINLLSKEEIEEKFDKAIIRKQYDVMNIINNPPIELLRNFDDNLLDLIVDIVKSAFSEPLLNVLVKTTGGNDVIDIEKITKIFDKRELIYFICAICSISKFNYTKVDENGKINDAYAMLFCNMLYFGYNTIALNSNISKIKEYKLYDCIITNDLYAELISEYEKEIPIDILTFHDKNEMLPVLLCCHDYLLYLKWLNRAIEVENKVDAFRHEVYDKYKYDIIDVIDKVEYKYSFESLFKLYLFCDEKSIELLELHLKQINNLLKLHLVQIFENMFDCTIDINFYDEICKLQYMDIDILSQKLNLSLNFYNFIKQINISNIYGLINIRKNLNSEFVDELTSKLSKFGIHLNNSSDSKKENVRSEDINNEIQNVNTPTLEDLTKAFEIISSGIADNRNNGKHKSNNYFHSSDEDKIIQNEVAYDKHFITGNNNKFQLKYNCNADSIKIEIIKNGDKKEYICKKKQEDSDVYEVALDDIKITGTYLFNVYENEQLISSDLELFIEKSGLKIKDNH